MLNLSYVSTYSREFSIAVQSACRSVANLLSCKRALDDVAPPTSRNAASTEDMRKSASQTERQPHQIQPIIIIITPKSLSEPNARAPLNQY